MKTHNYTGKKSAQLSVRNIQMPLENHSNYLAKWNHYLLGLGNASVPTFWNTAKTIALTPEQRAQYMWITSVSELPTEPDADGNYWTILKEPTKPRGRLLGRRMFCCDRNC